MIVGTIGASRFGVTAGPRRMAVEAGPRRQVLGINVNLVIEMPVIDVPAHDDAHPASRGEPA
jgi:hypothetical protein